MKGLYRIRAYVGIFLAASAVALVLRLFVLEDYRIASPSMTPSLVTGDLVFVSKSAFNLRLPFSTYELFRFRTPRRGEVVAFTLPGQGNATFVKRVVALGGERFWIRNGELAIDSLQVRYRRHDPVPGKDESLRRLAGGGDNLFYEDWGQPIPHLILQDGRANYGPIDVPKDHFFVLGDNRTESVDGRAWGPVPYSSLKGKVSLVWMSLDESGAIRGERVGLSVR